MQVENPVGERVCAMWHPVPCQLSTAGTESLLMDLMLPLSMNTQRAAPVMTVDPSRSSVMTQPR